MRGLWNNLQRFGIFVRKNCKCKNVIWRCVLCGSLDSGFVHRRRVAFVAVFSVDCAVIVRRGLKGVLL